MKPLKASDPMRKYRLVRDRDYYHLFIGGSHVISLAKYGEIVSKSKPSTYDQVLIGEVLALLHIATDYIQSPHPRFLSKKVYDDLKSAFERSRREGEAKALALAKKLYLDDYNRLLQTRAWTKVGGSSGVLKVRINNKWGYCYSLRFSDGVDSITVECYPVLLVEHFSLFWHFKAWKIRELILLLNKLRSTEFTSSIQGVEGERLSKALELALRHDTTLGTALFLMARE